MSERSCQMPLLGPRSEVLQTLAEADFTTPKHLVKPNGQEIDTRLVVSGSGMAGLETPVENKEWAGMFNHYVKTAGASIQIGELLSLNGQAVDLPLMLDTVMLSHSGRRQFDEANWYPHDVPNVDARKGMSDTQLGVANLKERKMPTELVESVAVHGLGVSFPFDVTKTWNQKLPMYLDFRISQNAMSMEKRFEDLKRGVADGRFTQQFLDDTKAWAESVEKELFKALEISSYDVLAQNPAHLKARLDMAIKIGKFSQEEVEKIKGLALYKPKNGKGSDAAAALGVAPEELLAKLQLKPEDISDAMLAPERWERYIRRLYLNDAEGGVFSRLSELYQGIEHGDKKSQEALDAEFPQSSWWGEYARRTFQARKGRAHGARNGKKGIDRGISFYKKIEEKRTKKLQH